MCYTDGSKVDPSGENDTLAEAEVAAVGAGLYCESTEEEFTIDPVGRRLCNTVFRGELAGIWSCLKTYLDVPKILNFIDSANCLHAISNIIFRPWTLKYHKHRQLLQDILDMLRYRDEKGFTTVLAKIAAHRNVWGNETADKLAKRATQELENCDIKVDVGAYSLPSRHWPYKLVGREQFFLSDLG